jgi:hypothetical protein
MPSFVIIKSGRDAVLCDAGRSGYPDLQHGVPVTIRSASESTILLDDEKAPRAILSSTGQNDEVVLLVSGSSKNTKDRQKRAALARAARLLSELSATIKPMLSASTCPEVASSGVQQLSDWISREREAAERPSTDASDSGGLPSIGK